MILDTNVLIGIANSDPAAVGKAEELEAAGVPLRVPTMAIYELFLSVGKGDTPEQNRRTIASVLETKPTVEVTAPVARRAGVLEGKRQASEERGAIGPADAVIAASGLEYGEPVVTDDDDFAAIDGLAVEGY